MLLANRVHLSATSTPNNKLYCCSVAPQRGVPAKTKNTLCFQAKPARRASVRVAAMNREQLHSLPGVAQKRDPATNGFIFQQTMYRIKDPKVSLDFYTRIMGLTLLNKLDFPEMKFSLYFLGQYPPEEVPSDPKDRVEWTFLRPGTLELTHNWGTESDPDFKGYHNGNSDPRGFGHIGFHVPDVYAACKRFEELGVQFSKKPDDGKMKGLAFIKDPDGYAIEILNAQSSREFA
mmetsp:Transcript_20161/g.56154  ORF Transcript_20161/g.56154 Transcript_20161/m.56154 type:complete len:233 (-) Transcript_20161:265-963(-)